MTSQTKDTKFFTIAALWNWGIALLFIVLGIFNHGLLGLFLKSIPENFLWFNLFCCLVAVYGLGYYWIGQDVLMNRNIIKMGIIGKILVFILITNAWLKGVVTILAAGAGVVDLVFGLLFIQVLVRTKTEFCKTHRV